MFQVIRTFSFTVLCLGIIASTGWLVQPAHASESCINYLDYQHSLGSLLMPDSAVEAELKGDFLYVACLTGGVEIVNVSNPSEPISEGNYAFENAVDVELYGDYLLVGAFFDGLQILDITNPTNPQFVGTLPVDTSSVFSVKVVGDMALVGLHDGTLLFVDITDPTQPSVIGEINVGSEIQEIEVSNNVAYLAATWSGLQVVDFSDPAYPVALGEFPSTTGIFAVELSGSLAFVNERLNGMFVLDISNPATPTEIGFASVNDPGFMQGLDVVGQYAYAVGGGHLVTIDISNPSNPVVKAEVITGGIANGILVSDGVGYTLNGYGASLNAIDLANHLVAPVLGSIDLPGYSQKVFVHGDLALMAAHHNGLQIVDITNISNPMLLAEMAQPGETAGVTARDNLAYVANSTLGLLVVDISIPDSPSLVGTAYIEGTAKDIELAGDYAYVTDSWGYFHVVDIANPSAPLVVASLETPASAIAVEIQNNLAYVTVGLAGLLAIDISDPVNPEILDQCILTESASGLELIPGYAIVGAGYGGVVVVDISTYFQMFEANTIDLVGGNYVLGYQSGILYVGDSGGGLNILNFADPLAPELLEYRPSNGYTMGLYIADGFVAMAMSHLGLELVPFQCGALSGVDDASFVSAVSALTLHGNFPNPFNPRTEIQFSVRTSGSGRLDIYNVRGELIRNLRSGHFDEGPGTLVWNGRTDAGQVAASGVYFYRLEVGELSVTNRMVLVK